MDTHNFDRKFVSICFSILQVGILCILGSACSASEPITVTPTQITPETTVIAQPTDVPVTQPPTQPPPTATPICTDNLLFIDDLTLPDGTVVTPGSSLDKRWLVQNNGNCNWDSRYRLRLIAGNALGAASEQALYPARAGMQATVRILFTAPLEPGEYLSEWQAFDANGIPFGQSFFIKFTVGQ